jgi:hypothetical protein
MSYVKEYKDKLKRNLLDTYSNANEIIKSKDLEKSKSENIIEKGRGTATPIGTRVLRSNGKYEVKGSDGWYWEHKGPKTGKTDEVKTTTKEEKPLDTKDLSSPEVQKMAIYEIAEKFGKKAAYEAQSKLKAELIEKYGFTTKDKWDAYETRLKRLIKKGTPKAVMAYGTGGIGKTFTFEKVAKECGMRNYDDVMEEAEAKELQGKMASGGEDDFEEDYEPTPLTIPPYDYVVLTGKTGSQVIQRAMYEHRDKIIVFDDCDSMWENKDLVNVLKGALDSSGEGRVQWAAPIKETEKGKGNFVPSRFKFEGRMVFITNLTKAELSGQGGYADARPITESRASSIDLTMNMDETLERLTDIKDGVVPRDYKGRKMLITNEDKQAALDTLKDIKDYAQTSQMNTRTLSKVMQEASEQREETGRYDKKKLIGFMFQELGII